MVSSLISFICFLVIAGACLTAITTFPGFFVGAVFMFTIWRYSVKH